MLEDGAATRARITDAWTGLVRRSDPGDTLVLTYAGHGGQEPERVPGTERDGRDEVLLLGGFRSTGPGTRERIFDDELNQWFVEAGEHGLKVVFVADSCHSGTLTRSIDPRAPRLSLRTAAYAITDDMLALDIPDAAAALEEPDLDHVSFLAAGQEHERVPEIMLPEDTDQPEPRGALSYMFARAVEGAADFDRDGVLRRDELWRFVRENVRMKSEARQTPNLVPNTGGGEAVLQLNRAGRPPAAGAAGADMVAASPGSRAVRLTVLRADARTLAEARDTLDNVRVVSTAQSPDLIWDATSRHVGDRPGRRGRARRESRGAARGHRQVGGGARGQGRSARAQASDCGCTPHDGAHREGARIEIEVDRLPHPRLTLLGLSGNGVVHYLYPLPDDPEAVPVGRPFSLELKVTPPFGADHVVAVSARSPLTALNAELDALDGRPAARLAAKLLAEAAARADGWWSGIQGLFTVP